jgi:hypothetical protein
MRILTWLVAGLAGLILLLLLIGLVLPSTQTVERAILINAPPHVIYAEINDLRRFNEWTPWSERDPDMEVRFEGEDEGVGAEMHWRSGDMEDGVIRIVANEQDAFVIYEIDFGRGEPVSSRIDLEQERGSIRVTWRMQADLGWNIPARWLGLFLDLMVGEDYREGLIQLKARTEDRALDPFAD